MEVLMRFPAVQGKGWLKVTFRDPESLPFTKGEEERDGAGLRMNSSPTYLQSELTFNLDDYGKKV
jgi:hypothetical protein